MKGGRGKKAAGQKGDKSVVPSPADAPRNCFLAKKVRLYMYNL